jgi:CRP-like cAMP-binding protein
MPQLPVHDDITNLILRSLSQATFARLWPLLQPVDLARGHVMEHADDPVKNLYFVNRGIISLVETMQDGRSVEVGAVGIEGITDPNTLFSFDKSALDSIVQIPGSAFRVNRDALKREIDNDTVLRAIMQNYARFAYRQLAQTAACNRLHSLEERCCRWLLIAHDSALADTFPVTQEFLAMMLGVRRSGVSIAANLLKRDGLIAYSRGRVTVLNRNGLEEASCECYGAIQADLNDLYGIERRQLAAANP